MHLALCSSPAISAHSTNVPAPLRQSREAQFIMEELVANSVNVRVMGGLGEDATPAQREVFEIANEHRQLLRDHETIAADLRHDTRENPETGEVEPVPVHRIQGERRRAYENRMAELERQMRVLNEIDKPKRLADACDRTRAQMQQQRDMLAERREAEAVAEKALRDQRVQRMADGIVRMRTDHIG